MSRNSRLRTQQKRRKKANATPKRKPPKEPTPAELHRMKQEHIRQQEEKAKQDRMRQRALDIATPQSNPSMFNKMKQFTEKRTDG
jgi:hypothetical protein